MNKQQLANRIWASANNMRNKIDANEYKDYILGFIFYKFLSIAIHKIIQALDTSGIIVERGGKNAEYRSTRINSKGI